MRRALLSAFLLLACQGASVKLGLKRKIGPKREPREIKDMPQVDGFTLARDEF